MLEQTTKCARFEWLRADANASQGLRSRKSVWRSRRPFRAGDVIPRSRLLPKCETDVLVLARQAAEPKRGPVASKMVAPSATQYQARQSAHPSVSCLGSARSVLCLAASAVVSLAGPERGRLPAALSLSAGSNQCAPVLRPHKAGAFWCARINVGLLCAGLARGSPQNWRRPTILGPLLHGQV